MKILKRIFFLLFFTHVLLETTAQIVKNYDGQWKEIDNLIQNKKLPRTALQEVNKLYAQAKKDGQQAQVIKALVYMTHLRSENTENADEGAIMQVQKEISLHTEPSSSILKNLLAYMYWQYFSQHRWELYNRTATINFRKDDLATWGTEDFHKKISELFLQSLSNKNLLQATRLEPYNPVIIKGNVRGLRPTLYDLLAHTALSYFKSGERDIKKAAYAFEINDAKAFAPPTQFVQAKFSTKDSQSLEYKALVIYQQLLQLHIKDTGKTALIDVDIDRLQFVHNVAILSDKEESYKAALKKMYDLYGRAASGAGYLLAALYNQQASGYHPLRDTTYRFARLKASEILKEIVNDSSVKSEAWANSYNLLAEIERRSFSFELEKVATPNAPFKVLIKYKNISSVQLRVIKATEEIKKNLRENAQSWWVQIAATPALKTWQQTLPPTKDLQEHSVEIKVDALPVGEYVLHAVTTDSMLNNGSMGAQFFHVSNISWVHDGEGFFVLHRETGQPLEGATAKVYSQTYNYAASRYLKTQVGVYKTDKSGSFALNKKENIESGGYFLEVRHNNDYLFLDDLLYSYYSNSGQEAPKQRLEPRIFLFTDRSIYRPGQTIFFKGIVVQKQVAESSILTNYTSTLYLRNANYIITDSIQLTSNDFGSFNGTFILPQNVLNGYFQLTDQYNRNPISFSVEEYKRPKFHIDFAKVKETYKVGDTVSVVGSAKAYAGNHIEGAQVKYRVIRQPRFIYHWLFWRGWQPQGEQLEIAHGVTNTDANGIFKINFHALADKNIDKILEPVFDFSIYADITDANGETRSSQTTITAGYKSLLLRVSMPEQMPVDSLNKLFISTVNMNGQHVDATVSVTAFKLIPEQRLLRKRYWQQPDQFVMTKTEATALFPYDEYTNESNVRTWPSGPAAFTATVTTTAAQGVTIDATLSPGFYKWEFTTTDKDGLEVKDVQYTELYDEKNKDVNSPSYLWAKSSTPIEPGQKTTVQIGTSAADIFLVHSVDRMGLPSKNQQLQKEILVVNNEKKTFEYVASEGDRGGYGVSYFFVKHNRFYNYNEVIKVPWSNKELKIEYITFRDKTLPGSDEKWTVKLKGNKGQAVAAEVLASMYDASLDGFKPHTWSKPGLWPIYTKRFSWQSSQNFSSSQSMEKWNDGEDYRWFDKRYDQLLWTNERYNNVKGIAYGRNQAGAVTIRGVNSVQAKTAAPGVALAESVMAEKDALLQSADSVSVQAQSPINSAVYIRKNFNETAFFFPHLLTDKDGNMSFSFTTPETLTRWKLQTLGHTKELAFGFISNETLTQKELMVQPNAPRFLRQGDRLEFSAKVVNLSDKELTGQAELQLFDAATGQSVDGWFMNTFPNQYFTVAAAQSETVKFPMEVPFLFTGSLLWRVIVKSGDISDGEEQVIPVLTNKVLVTETLAMPMRDSGTKTFTLDNLLTNQSETLISHALTVEYTANPTWYAVQALPYLTEQNTESAEQTWNRYYANALAAFIAGSVPRIKQIMDQWKATDTAALLSNLQKNQQLKSALLEETPWVLQAKTETEQKKSIALLFDALRMKNDLSSSFQKLKSMQLANGGFGWFKGSPEDRYMTQYILTGIGRLKKLGALPAEHTIELNNMVQTALLYADRKIKEDYEKLFKLKTTVKTPGIDRFAVQYLYMRSFFPENVVAPVFKTAYSFYRSATAQNWTKASKQLQGMAALALHRTGDRITSTAILKSLKETAIINNELGMYWKNNAFGYSWWWWQAPIETQALMVEAFNEIGNDSKVVDDVRTWLVRNKHTTSWRTTKATADACYAMLLRGSDWLSNEPAVAITLGKTVIKNKEQISEAGTGYFKQTFEGRNIQPEMGKITVTVQHSSKQSQPPANATPSWGAVYWQYFEDMDKIRSAATPLRLAKKIFIEKNGDHGPVLTPVAEGDNLHVGDKIKVRLELRVDRDMEYVYMKDLRASALEPVNVLSGYKWQGALGYYETTKDANTGFFFDYLRKGTYVFEYALFVTHTGHFSAGLTTIQSLYAPEFSAHSEGVIINVE